MPVRRRAAEAGIVRPEDLGMLGRVFDATAVPKEYEKDREARAAAILLYFDDGLNDEATLISLVKSKQDSNGQ